MINSFSTEGLHTPESRVIDDVRNRVNRNVTDKVNKTISAFSDLVNELHIIQNASKGTPVNKGIKEVAAQVNNNAVMMERLLAQQALLLDQIVKNPGEVSA